MPVVGGVAAVRARPVYHRDKRRCRVPQARVRGTAVGWGQLAVRSLWVSTSTDSGTVTLIGRIE
jgi:hypothetical protein